MPDISATSPVNLDLLTSTETVEYFLDLCQKPKSDLTELEVLRQENETLRLKVLNLETCLKKTTHELALEKQLSSKKNVELLDSLRAKYEELSIIRKNAFDELKNHYIDNVGKLEQTEQTLHTAETNMSAHLEELHTTAFTLYQQLSFFEYKISAKSAKETLEATSCATMYIDKLGSPLHPDSKPGEGSMASPNSSAPEKSKIHNNTAMDNQALCTRDQVRFVVSGSLEAGILGDVQWLRSSGGSGFTPIYNAGGRARTGLEDGSYAEPFLYIPSIDDLFCTLRAQFTDPVSGATISSEIGPVLPDQGLLNDLLEPIRRNEAELRVLVNENDLQMVRAVTNSDGNVPSSSMLPGNILLLGQGIGTGSSGTMSDCTIVLNRKRLKIMKGKKQLVKQSLEDGVYVEPHADGDVAFSIYFYGHGLTFEAKDRQERDMIIALLRLFIQQNAVWSSDGYDKSGQGLLSETGDRKRERLYTICYLLSHMNQHMQVILNCAKENLPVPKAYPLPPQVYTSDDLHQVTQLHNPGDGIIEQKVIQYYNTMIKNLPNNVRARISTTTDTNTTNDNDTSSSNNSSSTTPGLPSVQQMKDIQFIHLLPYTFEQVLSNQVPFLTMEQFNTYSVATLSTAVVEKTDTSGNRGGVVPQFFTSDMNLNGNGGSMSDFSQSQPRGSFLHRRSIMQPPKPPTAPVSVDTFVPADIDDLFSDQVHSGAPGEGAFGGLTRPDDSSDDDDDNTNTNDKDGEDNGRRRASIFGGSGDGGETGDRIEPESLLAQVVIKDKESAKVATTDDVKAAIDGLKMGLGSSGSTSASGATKPTGGRRGRKTIVGKPPGLTNSPKPAPTPTPTPTPQTTSTSTSTIIEEESTTSTSTSTSTTDTKKEQTQKVDKEETKASQEEQQPQQQPQPQQPQDVQDS